MFDKWISHIMIACSETLCTPKFKYMIKDSCWAGERHQSCSDFRQIQLYTDRFRWLKRYLGYGFILCFEYSARCLKHFTHTAPQCGTMSGQKSASVGARFSWVLIKGDPNGWWRLLRSGTQCHMENLSFQVPIVVQHLDQLGCSWLSRYIFW